MLLKDLQKYIEKEINGTYIPVDLLKISKSIGYRHYVPKGPNKSFHGLPNSNFTLVVDGECCLDRLYGGFFSGIFFLFPILIHGNICYFLYEGTILKITFISFFLNIKIKLECYVSNGFHCINVIDSIL